MTIPPKAAIFDVGNVLYGWDIGALYRKLIPDPTQLAWFLRNVVTPDWHFQHDRGRLLAETIPELSARYPAHADLIAQYDPRWLETITGPIAGMQGLVTELADARIPLYAITNFSDELWARFRPTAPIFDLFQDIIVSGTERLYKPAPEIYRLARKRFALAPGEGLFIDDRLENIRGAKAEGFAVHHFTNVASLRQRLVDERLLPGPGRNPA